MIDHRLPTDNANWARHGGRRLQPCHCLNLSHQLSFADWTGRLVSGPAIPPTSGDIRRMTWIRGSTLPGSACLGRRQPPASVSAQPSTLTQPDNGNEIPAVRRSWHSARPPLLDGFSPHGHPAIRRTTTQRRQSSEESKDNTTTCEGHQRRDKDDTKQWERKRPHTTWRDTPPHSVEFRGPRDIEPILVFSYTYEY